MMSNATFQIVYDGPILQDSTMDVNQLAPALLALGKTIEEANFALNDSHTKVVLKVKASFRSGCFGIDFDVTQSLMEQTLNLFKESPISTAKELVEYLGFVGGSIVGVIGLIRWVKNKKIDEVVVLDNGNVKVIVDGKSIEVELKTIELYRSYKLRLALERAILEPLEIDGIETVALTTDPEKGFITIEKNDRHWFKAPSQEEQLIEETEYDINLQIVSVSFKDDNKWRFSDGGSPFFASILHEEFLNRVHQSEESFTSGDILRVHIKKRQWLSGETMKSEYDITEVIEHKKAGVQLKIPFRNET